jgi:hypothetical protein
MKLEVPPLYNLAVTSVTFDLDIASLLLLLKYTL